MPNPTMDLPLGEETRCRLKVLSEARDRTPHYPAVERFLDVEESLEAERRLLKSRWEKYELTGETIDHAEIEAWANKLDSSAETLFWRAREDRHSSFKWQTTARSSEGALG